MQIVWIVIIIALIVFGFYFLNFNFFLLKNTEIWQILLDFVKNIRNTENCKIVLDFIKNISGNPAEWGTFGDYIGGILNPIIAGFALYLIAKSYELQKKELEETRKLLEVSTKAQEKQVKLAALTALLNTNQVNIGILQSEHNAILNLFLNSEIDQKIIKNLIDLKKAQRSPFNSNGDFDDEIDEENRANEVRYNYIMSEIDSDKKQFVKRIIAIEEEIYDIIIKIDELKNKVDVYYS